MMIEILENIMGLYVIGCVVYTTYSILSKIEKTIRLRMASKKVKKLLTELNVLLDNMPEEYKINSKGLEKTVDEAVNEAFEEIKNKKGK